MYGSPQSTDYKFVKIDPQIFMDLVKFD